LVIVIVGGISSNVTVQTWVSPGSIIGRTPFGAQSSVNENEYPDSGVTETVWEILGTTELNSLFTTGTRSRNSTRLCSPSVPPLSFVTWPTT